MEQGWVVSVRVDHRAGQEAGRLGGACPRLTRCKGAGQLDGGTEDGEQAPEATGPHLTHRC